MRPPYRLLVVLLLVAWAGLTIRIGGPFTGHQDGNGIWISSAARNFTLYGADAVGFIPVLNPAQATPAEFSYYPNHPPFIVWSVTLSGEVFGQRADGGPTAFSARLVPAYVSLISFAALFVLARRLFGTRIALWSLGFYAFTPMLIYFGRMPNHEPPALLFLLLFSAVFVNWMRRPTRLRWGALLACAGLAMWTAWASAFVLAALGLVALWIGSHRQRLAMIALGGLTLLLTAAVPVFYELGHSGAINDLLDAFAFRSSNQSASRGSAVFSLGDYISRFFAQSIPLMTPLVMTLGVLGCGLLYRRGRPLARGVVFGWMLATVGYMLVFRNAFHVHDYYKIYFLPGLALAGGYAFVTLTSRRQSRRWALPAVLSLFVLSAIIGGAFVILAHVAADRRAYIPQVAQALQAQTTVDEIVGGNVIFRDNIVAYYAFRATWWEIPPEQADTVAAYVYCLEDPEADVYPPVLAGRSYTQIKDCRVYNRGAS
jgi:4-amino-4-deoxy-L-arabinose transferase-like glycosyltransferase